MPIAMTGPALQRAIRSDFDQTWMTRYKDSQSRWKGIIRFGLPAENMVELFGYGEPTQTPGRVPWGEEPASKAWRYRTYEITTLRWMNDVLYLRAHRELSNLGDIKRDAQRAGERYGTLAERILFQIILGSVDPRLLPNASTMVAPDGAGFFSATDGAGASRFGVSGGNILTGQTITTGPGFRDAVFSGIERMLAFQDPEGEPAFDEDILGQGITLVYPLARISEAAEAFQQVYTAQAVTTATSNAGVSNVFMDMGIKFHLIATPRLTVGTTAYMFANAFDVEPVVETVAKPVEEYFFDHTNSRELARKGLEEIIYEGWMGYGLNLPLGSLAITA